MKIEYFGHACFRITDKEKKKIVTDPYNGVGYALPEDVDADLITISHSHYDHNNVHAVKGKPVILDELGPFDFGGIKIIGSLTWHDDQNGELRGSNVVYRFTVDGMTICHLGDLGEPYSEKMDEILKDADIWMIPVGGTYTLDAKQAKEYVDRLKPKAVIPMHYQTLDCTLNIQPVRPFLKLFEFTDISKYSRGIYTPERWELEEGKTKIIYMEQIYASI